MSGIITDIREDLRARIASMPRALVGDIIDHPFITDPEVVEAFSTAKMRVPSTIIGRFPVVNFLPAVHAGLVAAPKFTLDWRFASVHTYRDSEQHTAWADDVFEAFLNLIADGLLSDSWRERPARPFSYETPNVVFGAGNDVGLTVVLVTLRVQVSCSLREARNAASLA